MTRFLESCLIRSNSMTSFESFQEIRRMVETAKASWAIWFKLYAYEEVATNLRWPFSSTFRCSMRFENPEDTNHYEP